MSTQAPPLTEAQYNESRGMDVNIIAWVFTGVGIAIVSLKLFARSQITKRLGWDDFFIFFALVCERMGGRDLTDD